MFEGVLALEGSITGEHGIGLTKAKFLPLEVGPETIALMKRVKAAFDPNGILNPGKIFPERSAGLRGIAADASPPAWTRRLHGTYLFVTSQTVSRSLSGSGWSNVRRRRPAALK